MDHQPTPQPPHRRAGDADVLALAEGLLAAMGEAFDRGELEVLRTVADSYPDAGRDGAGEVVAGLSALLGDFLAAGECEREAIAVHVRAWRFMASRRPGRIERETILGGLREVRDRYAAG